MKGSQGEALAQMEAKLEDAEANVPEPLPALCSA